MSEETNTSQALQNKLDLAMGNPVKDAVHENKGETRMVEEPKMIKRSFETSQQVPDKRLKLSPSPLMDLPNEIWMKILTYLPTSDILKKFNLTCKRFHSLAINPCAIKSLKLNLWNASDSSQYQEIVKVLKRSKTLNELIHSAINFSNYVPYFENGKIWLVEIANFVCSRVISYWVGTS